LANKFSQLVGHDAKGQQVIHGIKQLRAKAGGLGAFSSLTTASKHMEVIGHVLVSYEIAQTQYGAPLDGVKIVDIELADFRADKHEPGLYEVMHKNRDEWAARDKKHPTVTTQKAAINGLSEDFSSASEAIMPGMVEKAYGDAKHTGFNLFYNPRSLQRKGVQWRTPVQKNTNLKVASLRLAYALRDAQARKTPVQWVVHGDGSNLFSHALAALKNQSLDQHEVLFAAPTEDIAPLLQSARAAGMKLHPDIVKGNGDDWLNIANRLQLKSMRKALHDLGPDYAPRMRTLNEQAGQDRVEALSSVGAAAMAGFGVGSFLLAPGLPGAAAIGAGLIGAAGMYQKGKKLRNMAANRLSDPALNPHLHPFKDANEFNAHVAHQHGSHGQAFLALIRRYAGS
jgi:hypothetical protein